MNSDSPERAHARETLDKAVREYAKIVAKENGVADEPIVTGWAGYAEYTSIELEREDSTGNVVLVPDSQSGATSRGLLEFGRDAFRRGL